jgi:hypothetical protein
MLSLHPQSLHDAAIFCLGMAAAIHDLAGDDACPDVDVARDLEAVYWDHREAPLSPVARRLNVLQGAPVKYGSFVRPNAHLICLDFARRVLDAVWIAADPEGFKRAALDGFSGSVRMDLSHFTERWSAVAEKVRSLELPDHREIASAVQQESARLSAEPAGETNIMPSKLPPVHLLLKENPLTLAEYHNWLLKVIEAWHEYMRRGASIGVPEKWRVKLCDCVELAGLHGDRVGLQSLLGRRPSLIAHEPEAILRYLRLCQNTALAAMGRVSASPAPHRASTELQSPPIANGQTQEELSRPAQEHEKQRGQKMSDNRSSASSNLIKNSPPRASRDKAFICYSHKDTKFLDGCSSISSR